MRCDLVCLEVLCQAPPESVSKRAPSTTHSSLRGRRQVYRQSRVIQEMAKPSRSERVGAEDLATLEQRTQHAGIVDLPGRPLEDVPIEHDEVCKLPGLQ